MENISEILMAFIVLRFGQYLIERILAALNRSYYLDPKKQEEAMAQLAISREDMNKALQYASDKYVFSRISGWFDITLLLAFLAVGGFGYLERLVTATVGPLGNETVTGLAFFGVLGLAMFFINMPFSLYSTFVIEERHGFNRQTWRGFFLDQLKGLAIGSLLGGLILGAIIWIMDSTGEYWWILAWVAMSGFSVLTNWLYPTLLAPLFNKFSPLDDGELKDKIVALAKKVAFRSGGLFVMNASIRSSHGNAYFAGMFGEKRIVLFDTLIETLKTNEIVAVLAHELGHFKLDHVKWMLVRSVLMTGVVFYLMSLCLPLERFYLAFGFSGISNYAALVVFSLWFGLIQFLLNPLETHLSRRNEFAADAFALTNLENKMELGEALLKLRAKSQSLPISHPWFSAFYYSHPPMLERLEAMGFKRVHNS